MSGAMSRRFKKLGKAVKPIAKGFVAFKTGGLSALAGSGKKGGAVPVQNESIFATGAGGVSGNALLIGGAVLAVVAFLFMRR